MVDTATEFKTWRVLRPIEHRVQFATIEDRIERETVRFYSTLRRLLMVVRDGVVTAVLPIERADWRNLREIPMLEGSGYDGFLRSYMNDIYQFSKRLASGEIGVESPPTTREFMDWIAVKSRSLQELHSTMLRNRVRFAVMQYRGLEREAAIRAIFDRFTDTELQRGAELLATQALQAGRVDTFGENPGQVEVYTWSAVLDKKVCATCYALDGQSWDDRLDDEMVYPPLHPYCRCVVIAGKRYEVESLLDAPPVLPDHIRQFLEVSGSYA